MLEVVGRPNHGVEQSVTMTPGLVQECRPGRPVTVELHLHADNPRPKTEKENAMELFPYLSLTIGASGETGR